ncbi:MAG TPA: tRNA (adenosine(37)-N6)-threonylcarbamoyltransferase complex ATPase subunit type 1 TsaE [Bacteroidales bacterium]|nr:tRNA (adenosine(37)-N6)-threonylcarbamoyltransferase complex ATPase subunit type 1 TsaE [Bacteroidales bacterium]HQK37525.1 tRNA (adenosine(37)-N6)-threonylcarbamoyltransferase complex ATPase subunit type 1 TsaE [Bacteroidales bacterium]
MKPLHLSMNSLQDVPQVAAKLLPLLEQYPVAAFYGELGAGKTTLIAEICRQLGVPGAVTSPSFAIVNEYLSNSGSTIYHFDFYRIKDIAEAYDIGYEEYFFSGNICLIEWPERIEELLPDEFIQVFIEAHPDGMRSVTVQQAGNTE